MDGGRRPPRRARTLIVTFFVVVCAGIAGALLWSNRAELRDMWPNSAEIRDNTESVSQVPADAADAPAPPATAPDTFTAAGYLEPVPPFPIVVSALVPGRVDEFDVLEGTPVKAGEVLARLNSALQEKRVEELDAELAVSAAKLAQAEQVLDRAEKLAAIGSAPAKELERATAEAAISRAENTSLQAALDLARWKLEHATVRAPVDGAVFERLAQVGEFVSPEANQRNGAAVATLYDPLKIQAWVDVNQRDASRVKLGQRVDISLDADPGRTYAGRVIRIQPRASLQKNTVQVKVAIENPSPALRPDMSAKVSFFPPENGWGVITNGAEGARQ